MIDFPALSVVIPVYNGERAIESCLRAVYASEWKDFEVIVVEDHSTDQTLEVVRSFPCQVIECPNNGGPSRARNLGARRALGRVLFFLDADIVVQKDTLGSIVETFEKRPDVAALFGSYGTKTGPSNFVSVYKNLVHHYTHQTSNPDAITFCGGFGAIRRKIFEAVGGFDEEHWFLEDVEFGYRLSRAGHRILLDPTLQMTHLKRYSLASLVRSDVLGRAVPWTRLMLRYRIFRNDLNTRLRNVLSVPVSALLLMCPLSGRRMFLLMAPLLALAFVLLNRGFLTLALRERGLRFAAGSAALCWFGYLYSLAGVGLGVLLYAADRMRGWRAR